MRSTPLANTLLGNSGVNLLTGAAGDDIYDGGAGNDTFTDSVTTSNDTYRWGIGSGLDTLTDAGGNRVFRQLLLIYPSSEIYVVRRKLVERRDALAANPIMPRPISISAYVSGSGTDDTRSRPETLIDAFCASLPASVATFMVSA